MELKIPEGVEVAIKDDIITIKGKLGSTEKKINSKYMDVKVDAGMLILNNPKNPRIAVKASLVQQTMTSEIKSSFEGVQNGIEEKMEIIYAHFPISVDIKGKIITVKNLFGRKISGEAEIIGDTKVELKGQNLIIKGVDKYDVGQTIANVRKICTTASRGYDSRVFQDGIYKLKSE
jgi:large subunit ribosomal protein L6